MTLARTDLDEQIQLGTRGYVFLRAMIEAQGWDSGLIMEFLDKPWKWTPEYATWRDCGMPQPGDETFAEFEQRIEQPGESVWVLRQP